MTTCFALIVEEKNEARLLQNLLLRCVPAFEGDFYAAQGQLAFISLARNIAVDLGCPMMLVSDANFAAPETAVRFKAAHLQAMERLLPLEFIDVFIFTPTLQQVIAEAVAIEIENLALEDQPNILHDALSNASTQTLLSHAQLATFICAVQRMQAQFIRPSIAAEHYQLLEPAA